MIGKQCVAVLMRKKNSLTEEGSEKKLRAQ